VIGGVSLLVLFLEAPGCDTDSVGKEVIPATGNDNHPGDKPQRIDHKKNKKFKPKSKLSGLTGAH
jgi:hypothetical protein